MTMRELCSALKCIRRRTNAKMAFQASLRGLKLNMPTESAAQEFNEQEDAVLEKQLLEAQKRKQAQIRGTHGG